MTGVQIRINPESLYRAGIYRRHRNLIGRIAETCCHNPRDCRSTIYRLDQGGTNIRHRIASFNTIADRYLINCDGIDVTRLNSPFQLNYVTLMRRGLCFNRSDIIAAAKIDSLNILNLNTIRFISEGQRINAAAQIKHHIILGNREAEIVGMTAAN